MSRTIAKQNAREIDAEKLAELKRNAEAILADVRMNFQREQPFVGSISMSLNLIPTRDRRNPTASTDGTNLYFDIAFLSELSPNERMFVLGHEVYHNVMLHFIRQGGRDRELWNIAADMEVNNILATDGLIPPASAILPKTYGFDSDLSAEEYYDKLLQRQRWQQSNSSSSSQKGDGYADGESGDGQQGGAPTKSGNAEGKLDGQFDKHIYDDEDQLADGSGEGMSDKYGAIGEDEDFKPNVKEQVVEKIREAAVSAAQQIERQRGELPAHLQRLVSKLLEPEVNWKERLTQFVTRAMANDPTWNRPNRRFAWNHTYLPGHEGQHLNVAVVLDTSGSTAVDAERFLAELNGIVTAFGSYKLTIVHCDAQVQHVEEYDDDTPFVFDGNGFEMHGGGGTRLMPAFEYIDVNGVEPDVIVAFTDGWTEKFTPDMAPNAPVLWLISPEGGTTENAGFGEVVNFK